MLICPDCKGSGKTGLVHINRGDQPHEWREGMPCWRCDGTGKIPDEMRDWMERGEVLRKARITREVSLRERAKELGISASELSAMERGRTNPARVEGRESGTEGRSARTLRNEKEESV
jgi:ribosome-binding protein aMBF1 (putative translation factor)